MSAVDTILELASTDAQFPTINSMRSTHPALPKLLFLLGGSAVNRDFYEELDTQVAEGGKLEGQSKRQPDTEDLIDVDVKETEFIRPNGEKYFARDWTGMLDVEVLRVARTHMQFPLLYGPPGTGKTAMCEAAFGEDLITMVLSGDTEVRDLVGSYMPNPLFGLEEKQAEYIWVDGPLVRAMEEGRPFLADEVGLGDPKVLSILYGAMDGRREILVTDNPKRGLVKAKDGFFVVGSTNPNAPGVNLSEALLSRFTMHVEVTTDWALAVSKLGVPESVAGIAQSLSRALRNNEIAWAPQMRELIAFRDLAKIYGERFAFSNMIALAPEDDREMVQNTVQRIQANALAARIGQ